MPEKWYMMDFTEWACRLTYHIEILSDVPCHGWLRWSRNHPRKRPKSRVLRGLAVWGDVYYCFTSYYDVEQNEPGDTLVHTFDVFPWDAEEVRYFYIRAKIGAFWAVSQTCIFGRSIDFTQKNLSVTITHQYDAAVLWSNEIVSFPPSCPAYNTVGRLGLPEHKQGGAFRFRNVDLPLCPDFLSASLWVNAAYDYSNDPVHARISAENQDSADNFYSITTAGFWARYAIRAGITDWNNLPHFLFGQWYESPSLIAAITAITTRPGWKPGNAIVIFFEDFDQRTPLPAGNVRVCRVYAPPLPYSPVLEMSYNHWTVQGRAVF